MSIELKKVVSVDDNTRLQLHPNGEYFQLSRAACACCMAVPDAAGGEAASLSVRLAAAEAEADALRAANAKLTRSLAWMSAALSDHNSGRPPAEAHAEAETEAAAAAAAAEARAARAEASSRRLSAEREALFDLCNALRFAAVRDLRGSWWDQGAAAADSAASVYARTCTVDRLGTPSYSDLDEQDEQRAARGHITVTRWLRSPPEAPEAAAKLRRPRTAVRAEPRIPTEGAAKHCSLPTLPPLAAGLQLCPPQPRRGTEGASGRETASQAAAAAALGAAAQQRAARAAAARPKPMDWAAARKAEAATGGGTA